MNGDEAINMDIKAERRRVTKTCCNHLLKLKTEEERNKKNYDGKRQEENQARKPWRKNQPKNRTGMRQMEAPR